MNRSTKHIELLDYLRGIAIIAVLLFHTLSFTYGHEELPWNGWHRSFSVPASFLAFLPCSFGQAGVALFFVISGFCIHLSFQQQRKDWAGFWIRRFWRIYPAYIAAVALAVLFLMSSASAHFDEPSIWVQLAAHLFLVHNFGQTTFMALNGSFWSLAIEAQLYLLYPLLLLLVARLGWRQSMIALGCCEFLIRGANGVVQAMGVENTSWGHTSWLLSASPLGYWFSWAIGARLAESFLKSEPLPFSRIPLMPWLVLAVSSYFTKLTLPFLFVLAAIVAAIGMSKLLSGFQSRIQAPGFFLNTLKKIGLWSYSIYLLHEPLMHAYCLLISNVIPRPYLVYSMTFLYIVASWTIIILISVLSYRVFEIPSIAFGKWIVQMRDRGTELSSKATEPFIGPAKHYYLLATTLLVAVAGIFVLSSNLNQLDSRREVAFGEFLNAKYKYSAALMHYHSALRFDGDSVSALNDAAWLLATAPDPRLRNATAAVALARRACKLTGYQRPFMIGTLAAACAEAGHFDEAIANAQKARDVALRDGQKAIAAREEQFVELYKAGKPFHLAMEGRP